MVVIDNDPLVLEGMGGILRSWGCRVITATTDSKALEALTEQDTAADLIISDYHLSDGRTGLEAIARLRGALSAHIPAFLISGDTDPVALHEAKANGCHLLHKPVDPMALRAMFSQAISRPRARSCKSCPLRESEFGHNLALNNVSFWRQLPTEFISRDHGLGTIRHLQRF